MVDESLSGKCVVITGASSGFGKGAARKFAQAGASVVLAARRGQLIRDLAEECETIGGHAIAVPTDVSQQAEVEHLASIALSRYGCIDVWVNNAGVGAIGRFEAIPVTDHVQVIETDLLGTLYGSYCAYQQFIKQGSGVLINIASELGKNSVPYYTSYTAAKHGVVGLSDSLRQEVELNGLEDIHICTILPTAHDTPFFDHVANYTGHEIEPPKPLHDPNNVAEAILRIARNPRDEEIVGVDGVFKVVMSNVMPSVAKKIGAKQMHKTQYEKPPPGVNTSGAVRAPMMSGTSVSAGRRQSR